MAKTSYKNLPAAPPEETAVAVVVVDDMTFMDKPAPPVQESAPTVQPPGISLGRRPFDMTVCPMCSETDICTRTRTYPTLLVWICVAIVAVVLWPLCWIPLVVDPLKQTDHYCQKCGEKVGETRPLEDCCVIQYVQQ
jgi:lipopolysaccharide-induced tumor necrosis factor-alpha factor